MTLPCDLIQTLINQASEHSNTQAWKHPTILAPRACGCLNINVWFKGRNFGATRQHQGVNGRQLKASNGQDLIHINYLLIVTPKK